MLLKCSVHLNMPAMEYCHGEWHTKCLNWEDLSVFFWLNEWPGQVLTSTAALLSAMTIHSNCEEVQWWPWCSESLWKTLMSSFIIFTSSITTSAVCADDVTIKALNSVCFPSPPSIVFQKVQSTWNLLVSFWQNITRPLTLKTVPTSGWIGAEWRILECPKAKW